MGPDQLTISQKRSQLVNTICSLGRERRRPATRSFLEALSGDELGYIAGYLGSRVLDPSLCANQPAKATELVAIYETRSLGLGATAHKMLLLRDFLRLSGAVGGDRAFAAASA